MTIIVQPLCLGNGDLKVLVKDSIDIQNTRTESGSPALAQIAKASQHAEIIEHILNNNCEIVGKTNLHELAFGITGINAYTGTPINPHYPSLIPGGSSSGSAAAVAANLCDFSIGTDTGGSIRMPAACCGVLGLKPSYARVSRKGVSPEHSSLDCVGPFANNMATLMHAMQIIDPSFDVNHVVAPPLSQLKIAVLDVPADPEIWHSIQHFLAQSKVAAIQTVQCKYMDEAFHAAMQIINFENFAAFGKLIPTGKLGQDIATRLTQAGLTTAEDVAAAEQVRALFCYEINVLLSHADVLVLPTLPVFPPHLSDAAQGNKLLNLTALVRPFNLSGHPALNIPLQSNTGQPLGLQLIAKHGQDEKLCLIAQALIESAAATRNQVIS